MCRKCEKAGGVLRYMLFALRSHAKSAREAQEGGSYRGREGGTVAATLAYPRITLQGVLVQFFGFSGIL